MAQLAATASSRCISKFKFDMPPWEDSNFDVMETCVKQASSPQRKLFSWNAATVCTTPCKSVFRRSLKEMNFHFAHRSSNPMWSGTQSVSNGGIPGYRRLVRWARQPAGGACGARGQPRDGQPVFREDSARGVCWFQRSRRSPAPASPGLARRRLVCSGRPIQSKRGGGFPIRPPRRGNGAGSYRILPNPPPFRGSLTKQARSQQPGSRVIAEEMGIAHIAAQRVHTPMAALVHHFEDRGAAPRRRCEEAGLERMAGEELRVKSDPASARLDHPDPV